MKTIGVILGIFILVGISNLIVTGSLAGSDDSGESMISLLITLGIISIIVYVYVESKKNNSTKK